MTEHRTFQTEYQNDLSGYQSVTAGNATSPPGMKMYVPRVPGVPPSPEPDDTKDIIQQFKEFAGRKDLVDAYNKLDPIGLCGAPSTFVHEIAVIVGAPEGSSYEAIKACLLKVMGENQTLRDGMVAAHALLRDAEKKIEHMGRERSESAATLAQKRDLGPSIRGISEKSPYYRKSKAEEHSDYD